VDRGNKLREGEWGKGWHLVATLIHRKGGQKIRKKGLDMACHQSNGWGAPKKGTGLRRRVHATKRHDKKPKGKRIRSSREHLSKGEKTVRRKRG